MAGYTGKQGWAVKLSTDSTTPDYTEQKNGHFKILNTVSHVVLKGPVHRTS
jgi:hypothetical protein